jgi:tRNA-specific 2-thiouridylase
LDKARIKVLVAMSGGVDSSVAAALLKEQGYDLTGVTMKIWGGQESVGQVKHHGCYGPGEEEDIEDARKVAERLNIPFHVIDLTSEYQSVVLDYFCEEYLSGRTPNPCVRCNHRIKFNALINKARDMGLDFDLIASGHYARIEKDPESGRYLLKKACDPAKDQSYFLCFLSQAQLGSLMFPLGTYNKAEVREMAARFGLQVADKPDSQNFVSGEYSSVIKTHGSPGPIMNKEGKVLGQHRGLEHYTIGQRRGLEISAGEPVYVTAIDQSKNAVILGDRNDLQKTEFSASKMSWIAIPGLAQPTVLNAKIRSGHKGAEATVSPKEAGSVLVKFNQPQTAVSPGQVVVFYQGDSVVGGGIID